MTRSTFLRALALSCLALCFALPVSRAAEAAKPKIKVGAIFAVTGPAAFLGLPEKNTAELLVAQLNAKGGISGHPIELIVKDSAGSPEKTLSFAKQLIEEERVMAIIGPSRSGEAMAIKNLCEETGTLLLACAAAEDIVNPVAKWVFNTPQKDSAAVLKIYERMKAMGIKKIACLSESTGYGNAGKEQLKKYAADYGLEIVLNETYDAAATDLSDLIAKVKGAKVDAVVNWSITPAQGIVAKNMRQKGLTIPLFQSHGFGNPRYVALGGEASEGILFPCGRLLVADKLADDHPQKQVLVTYKQDYEAKYKENVSTFGGHAWDALMILARGIEVGGTDKAKVREAIENLKGFVGTAGVFSYSPTDHNGLTVDAFAMLTVKGGQFVPAD
jgi:branched-chain amino acid transport system substrate-binding protein